MKLLVAILAAKICSSINLDKQEANSFLRPKRAIGSQNCVGSLFGGQGGTNQVACDCVLNTCDYEEYLESQENVQDSVRSSSSRSTRNSFENDYRECYQDLLNQKMNQYQLFLPNGEKFNFKHITLGACEEEFEEEMFKEFSEEIWAPTLEYRRCSIRLRMGSGHLSQKNRYR